MLPWRKDIQAAIETAISNSDPSIVWPVTGPVDVHVVFTMKKPTTAPKRKRTWPEKRPDIEKLVRCVHDALTNAGAVRDDSQVIRLVAAKVYPNEGPYALPTPGVTLTLSHGDY